MPIRCKLLSMLALLAVAALAAAHPKLSSGPMIAYAEMTETAIWVQTTEDAEVSLRYWPIQSAAESATIGPVRTNAANDHIALLTVTGLPFGTKFGYEIRIDNQPVEFNHPLEFQTQPHWRWATNPPVPPEFTFALGSCAYINDTPFDRPGRPYGDGMQIFESIHKLRPELMLWMGDNVYFREADWLTPSAMRYRWRQNRALPEMQPLLASTAHYAIWDDHDYGPNDSDWTFNLRPDALQIFREYFPSLQSGLPDTPGVFFRFVWGDVEFFMLDNRYHRTPN
ncbi:MAG: alkaline phosphatase D family protein, partial [Fimbriimonadaceae bacterium]